MNVLCLDQTGCFVDFALRCMAAGHHVRLCIARDKKTNQRSKIGDGLVEKIEGEEWQKSMQWADLVLCSDNVKWLKELDGFKRKGYPVFAPSYESANLELIRSQGQALLQKRGCKVIPYESFTEYGRAERYVREQMTRLVSKPDGDIRDKSLSYVSQSPADMIYMLRCWSEKHKNVQRKFMLQEFVPGVEFAVNGWLGPKGFSRFIEESFEHKKLMNDDKGPNTGETGTAIKYVADSALAKEVLLPLEGDLIRMGHTGSVDVSVIVDENGEPRPLEFTSRLGWPAFNIAQVLHPDPCEWMADLLEGNDTFEPSTDVAIGVVMAIPDFPYSNLPKSEVSGVPIYHLDDDNPHRWQLAPCEVMSGSAPAMVEGEVEDKRLMVSAGDYLVVASGTGKTVREAKAQAYQAAASVEIPNSVLMRTDIGDRCKRDIAELQQHGFANEWEY